MTRTPQLRGQSTPKWWLGHPVHCWLTLPDDQDALLMAWMLSRCSRCPNQCQKHPTSGWGTPINAQHTPEDG